MTLPSVSDLQTFLGNSSIDSNRALMMLDGAYNLCSSIVTPLPETAAFVVLTVAARAFSNPEGITSETVGPFSVQRASAGLYLTKSDKATLRRLSGRKGAFSADTLPTGVSAVQLVTILGAPTGGTFTLSFGGQLTTALPFNATASAVQVALGALSIIGSTNISVSGNGPYTVTFIGDLATCPVDLIVGISNLTGGTNPSVQVTNLVTGVFGPGQNLPYWDASYLNLNGTTIVGRQ